MSDTLLEPHYAIGTARSTNRDIVEVVREVAEATEASAAPVAAPSS
ncbi:MAG TPA: hypothetical protein VFA19_00630 [Gaiellaceae bacterium]|nr:hypothetical protein [Gaiellaceae bacterium]